MKPLRIAHLTIAVVLGFLVVASPAAAAPDQLSVAFQIRNPCNQEVVRVTGDAYVIYNGQGSKHVVNYRASAESEDQTYQLNFIANGVFEEPSGSGPAAIFFDVSFRAIFVGQGQAPDFEVEGINRIFVDPASGGIIGSQTQGVSSVTCLG